MQVCASAKTLDPVVTVKSELRRASSFPLLLRVAAKSLVVTESPSDRLTYSAGEKDGVAALHGADCWLGLVGELRHKSLVIGLVAHA